MLDGHHHGTGYDFMWDDDLDHYVLSEVQFLEMEGCWSLRWTFADFDSLDNSQEIIRIMRFNNLNEDENLLIMSYCNMCRGSGADQPGDHNH